MDILATIQRGAPPIGLGMFARDRYVPGPWSFVAINGGRADYQHEAGLARADGKDVWLYAFPGSFEPATWRDGLAMLVTRAAEVGAVGIMVDPETEWGGNAAAAEIPAFGAALRAAAETTRVGVTSYPAWAHVAALGAAAGDACFGVPQIYGQPGAFTQSDIDAQWSRWRQAFGTRLIVGFALWVPDSAPKLATPAEYSAYLARLPMAPGAIGWTAGPIPVHMMQSVTQWGRGASMLALGALAWAGRPVGAIVLGVGIALLIMTILLAREVTRA